MDSKKEVELLEKLFGQLQSLHEEIAQLAKKTPNDGLNPFKLKMVNKVVAAANTLLTDSYRPFDDFEQFNSDDLPSNSDVTVMLAQYIEQIERFRSHNVVHDASTGGWCYRIDGKKSDIPSRPPTRVGGDRK